MDTMLSKLYFAIAYLDNILINSENIEQHKKYIHEIFRRIKDDRFKLKDKKCDFFMKRIKYLGQIIDKDDSRPDPEWASAIKNMLALESFLSLANYYNIFVPNMHDLQAPLNELLKKRKRIGLDCLKAFKKIKGVLTSNLFLTHSNPKQEIIEASDTSTYSIGTYILHKFDDRSIKPIGHVSRTLLLVEKNYSQVEKESLRIIFAVTKFYRFIHGRHFILKTTIHCSLFMVQKRVCKLIQQIGCKDKLQLQNRVSSISKI